MKNRIQIVVVIFLFLSSFSYIKAQEFRPVRLHIDTVKGLPDLEIYRMLEDKNKHIWIASNSGLYEFDGNDYILHRAKGQLGQAVFGLIIDHDNNIWYTNLKSQIIKCDIQKHCTIIEEIPGTSGFTPLLTSTDKGVLVVHRQGAMFIKTDGNIKNYILDDSFFPISNAVEVDDNTYAFCNNGRLVYYENDKFFVKSKYPDSEIVLGSPHLLNINDRLILINQLSDGISQYELKPNKKEEIDLFPEIKNQRINNVRINSNTIWFSSNGGIFRYEIEDGKVKLKQRLLKDKLTTDFFEDYKGNRWISTINSGIFVLPLVGISELFISNKANYTINQITPQSDSLVTAMIDKSSIYNLPVNNNIKPNSIPVEKLVEQDLYYHKPSDKLWLHSGKLTELEPSTLKIKKQKDIVGLKQMAQYKDHFFASFYNGFRRYDSDLNLISNISKRASKFALTNTGAYGIVQFEDSLKIVRTSDFEIENTTSPFFNTNQSLHIITNPNVKNGVYLISNKNIDTDGHKSLHTITKIKAKWVVNDESKWFKKNTITPISLAANGKQLFVLTNKGLCYRQHSNIEYQFYDADGFIEWAKIQSIKISDNTLWLTSKNNIIRIDLSLLKQQSHSPNITFKYDAKNFNSSTNKIELKSFDTELVFEKSSVGISNFSSYKPQYRFSNYPDSLWKDAVNYNNKTYVNNIPNGKSELHLRYYNPYSKKRTTTSNYSIVKAIPYYRTWWFYVLLAIVIIYSTVLIWDLRTKYIRKQLQLELNKASIKNEITNLKLENLRSQMNPHFVFNSLNSVQDYIISNNIEKASNYLIKFSRLIRLYLNHSRLSHISLRQEIEALKLYTYLEKNRIESGFTVNINIDPDLDTQHISVPSLFLQPYVENAINHGLYHKSTSNKVLTINLKKNNNYLRIEIIDNGIGRNASKIINKKQANDSFSIMANDKRISLLNTYYTKKIHINFEDLLDENRKSAGTKVLIKVPIQIP